MDALIWILMPGFVAVGSGLLAFFVMQSRMDVAIAREREALAETRGKLDAQKRAYDESIRGVEEAARRQALDDFLGDIRVEQRHYVRQTRQFLNRRRSLVLEERIFFRNLPLSNWIEREIVVDEISDIDALARRLSVFDRNVLALEEAASARS